MMWEVGSQKIVARMFPYFLLIGCQGKVTTTLVDKVVRVNNFKLKTNLQIKGCGGGKGRRGGEYQDHPIVIINGNLQSSSWVHFGCLGMNERRSAKLT